MLSEDSPSLIQRMHNFVREHPDFEVLHAPTDDLYCFRYLPNRLAELQEEIEIQRQLDRLNLKTVEAIRNSGLALLVTTHIRGRVAIQMSIRSKRILETDIDTTFEAVAQWGHLLSKSIQVSRHC